MFEVKDTDIEGLKLIETTRFVDDRGLFRKVFSENEFSGLGLETDFRESYYSTSKKNVIRGMHFQIPPSDHVKLVYVVSGKILDVCLDVRKKSKTYGRFFSVELSESDPSFVYIPKGIAHGFLSIEDDSVVHYMQTSCYDKSCDSGIRYDSFDFDWGIIDPVLSPRDLAFSSLANFSSLF